MQAPEAQAATTPLQRVMRRRDCTRVALLAVMPLRWRASAGLRLGQWLIATGEAITVA